jgi:hypothetical protein
MEALGTTRKIEKREGEQMYVYEISATMHNGEVPEGEIIPLSEFEQTKTAIGEITLLKWRKATSAEAILKSGYETAVRETDAKAITEIQKGVRTRFFTFLGSVTGSTAVTGAGLQEVLAQSWGQLQVLFDNDTIEAVHFVHPLDIADYLATANITLQTAFGMQYIENFMGYSKLFLTSRMPANKIVALPEQNTVLYHIDATDNDFSKAGFEFRTDGQDNLIAVHVEGNHKTMVSELTTVSGIGIYAEYLDGIAVVEVNP